MYKSITAYLTGMLIAALVYYKYPVQGSRAGIVQFAFLFVLIIFLINVTSHKRDYIWETRKVDISDFCWAPFFNVWNKYNGGGNPRLRLVIDFAMFYMSITSVLSLMFEAYGQPRG